ncbi:Holliday junction branch migration protein RuvA [Defluviitalea phaphyphila]|uniref:Holliday junction branch migration protein RuvA n=1 Tax=Defluviitalea phaphyphila TaxID=1473580 RepID=UPI000731CDF2|nr:Holliday junction branch migration protein RuvA [Defluviitalea phaphyphila]
MISYVKGRLEYIGESYIIIEVNGIGYKINIPSSTIEKLPSLRSELKMFTYFYVKEDEMSLYGFLSREELTMFERLISVSGIGPKVAVGILSTISPQDLCLAVITEDIKTLSTAPGVGKKTAQRMILELKDKIDTVETLQSSVDDSRLRENNVSQEAISALIALGYSRIDGTKAVQAVFEEGMTVEEVIKAALNKLAIF